MASQSAESLAEQLQDFQIQVLRQAWLVVWAQSVETFETSGNGDWDASIVLDCTGTN